MTTLRRLALSVLVVAGAASASVVACRNQVPPPTLPLPAPEVTPVAPKPKEIKPRKARPRVAHVPTDAGVSDVIDLPPVVDADVPIVSDAAQPLE